MTDACHDHTAVLAWVGRYKYVRYTCMYYNVFYCSIQFLGLILCQVSQTREVFCTKAVIAKVMSEVCCVLVAQNVWYLNNYNAVLRVTEVDQDYQLQVKLTTCTQPIPMTHDMANN